MSFPLGEILFLVFLTFLEGFFVAAEIALVSVRRSRIDQLVEEGRASARRVRRLIDDPGRFLAVAQIGLTMIGFFASAFAAVSLVDRLQGLLESFGMDPGAAGGAALIVVTIILALFTIVFAELIPKSIALASPERFALILARPIDVIARLLGPVVRAEADYVAPLYARHKHDGTITNSIAYPLTRALYGLRIRQPIGGEFGFHTDLARAYLAQPVWESDVARFGIDIFMTTTAVARHARVVQAFLGAKIHDPKDPAADLGPMFTQVVGTLFRLASEHEAVWREVSGSRPVKVVGDVIPVEPEAIRADAGRLRAKYEAGAPEQRALWDEILSENIGPSVERAAMSPDVWARVVFDFLTAALKQPGRSEELARGLLPLYYLRVAEFIDEARDLTTAQSEDIVEVGARAFEKEKQEHFVEKQETAQA